jgi:hypothetical protein
VLDDLDVGVQAVDRRSALSTFAMPTRSVVWMTWRWRFETSTSSSSTEAERADARRGEVQRDRRAEAAGAEEQDLGVESFCWPSSPISGSRKWRE